ncbi:hypothetical protein QN277_001346 [Acacia crassicarpa]|uniref:MAR-binding filament-like protein 1 n=1 Tax=Acacia crassicarpa TaxID=499986 RepID=A0AAE1TI84_9FABA|nr:hypothetical protein QN277_001346 [Acacia crassicarpa]
MATLASFLSPSLPRLHRIPSHSQSRSSLLLCFSPLSSNFNPRKLRTPLLVVASSAQSFDDFSSKRLRPNSSKKSVLLELIQEIEPLDVSQIQKDVPPTTVDAMKRTISSMLGLLPSDQFQVVIEALWEPLSKLLISSIITGYTLRNAEYRLFLEKNLDMHERDIENPKAESTELSAHGLIVDRLDMIDLCRKNDLSPEVEKLDEETIGNVDFQNLGEISTEVQQYIYNLQSRLSSIKKELNEVKRKNAALQMQQFVGEEKNDLLDYLRSLQPEQVAELSESTSSELKNTIHSVVHGLLATLSPKMLSKASTMSENATAGTINGGIEDCSEFVENASLQFHPVISLTRDYLARLLFWCMLLGHYLRGLEYRMELMEVLSLSDDS